MSDTQFDTFGLQLLMLFELPTVLSPIGPAATTDTLSVTREGAVLFVALAPVEDLRPDVGRVGALTVSVSRTQRRLCQPGLKMKHRILIA
jgi:hypothetical protein